MLEKHFERYATTVKEFMIKFRDGILTLPNELGRTHKILVEYKVQNNSPTWKFLDKYSQDINLRKLLCGSWDDLLGVVSDVENWIPDLAWQKKATKAGLNNGDYLIINRKEYNRICVDHFNEIMSYIFVNNMYVTHFDKTTYIENLGLRICPYCGRQHINVAKLPRYMDSKPNIDHFLPKSLYPFLAISFRNLIPCCSVCNEMANKGNYDPLKPEIGLFNPYEFDDSSITFKVNFGDIDEMDEKSYDIGIDYNPPSLKKGYIETLKLLEFYRQEKLQAQDIYINFAKNTQHYKIFLNNLGVEENYLNDYARMVLGHPLDGKASQRVFYKFKRDLFLQLVRIYNIPIN